MGPDRALLVQRRCLSLSWQRRSGYEMRSLKWVLLLASVLVLVFLYYSIIIWAI